MNTDALKSIIEDAHKLAKADIAPDLVKPAVETIALRLERLVKDGLYVTPEAARKFAEEHKDLMGGKSLNQILLNPPLPELTAPVVRTRIVVTPNGAAMKYDPLDDELPRLSAHIDTVTRPDGGKASQTCTLYVGGEVLAYMAIYRGKNFAVRMVKQALKGAMSRLGKRRRLTANRRAREAAAGNAANA